MKAPFGELALTLTLQAPPTVRLWVRDAVDGTSVEGADVFLAQQPLAWARGAARSRAEVARTSPATPIAKQLMPGEVISLSDDRADAREIQLEVKVAGYAPGKVTANFRDGDDLHVALQRTGSLIVEVVGGPMSDGKISWSGRRPWRDGANHLSGAFVMTPNEFIARLAAIVPHPREHQLTVQGGARAGIATARLGGAATGGAEGAEGRRGYGCRGHRCRGLGCPAKQSSCQSYIPWATLLRRVLGLDILRRGIVCAWSPNTHAAPPGAARLRNVVRRARATLEPRARGNENSWHLREGAAVE